MKPDHQLHVRKAIQNTNRKTRWDKRINFLCCCCCCCCAGIREWLEAKRVSLEINAECKNWLRQNKVHTNHTQHHTNKKLYNQLLFARFVYAYPLWWCTECIVIVFFCRCSFIFFFYMAISPSLEFLHERTQRWRIWIDRGGMIETRFSKTNIWKLKKTHFNCVGAACVQRVMRVIIIFMGLPFKFELVVRSPMKFDTSNLCRCYFTISEYNKFP